MTEEVLAKPVCSDCGSSNVIFDHEKGESVCADCGLVLTDHAVLEKPPVYYPDGKAVASHQSHHISPTVLTVHDKCLPTTLQIERDARGKLLSGQKKNEVRRMKKLQKGFLRGGSDRSLAEGLISLRLYIEKLCLPPDVHSRASVIFRKAQSRKLVRGRSINEVLSASIYIACREVGLPRNHEEIAKIIGITTKTLTRCYRLLFNELELKVSPTNALSCLSVYASNLNLSGEVVGVAARVIRDFSQKTAHLGKNPRSIAASALYIACRVLKKQPDITQSDCAFASGLTEVTVRNVYKVIVHALDLKEVE